LMTKLNRFGIEKKFMVVKRIKIIL
jgi:hypothetical protein